MKTRFTAVLLAVFIAFSLTIYASADTWPNFGTVIAGTACNQAISDADGAIAIALHDADGDGVPETALPAGLSLAAELDPATGLSHYFLRGTPLYAGEYSFVLATLFADESSQLLHCSLHVDPALPAVLTSADVVCGIGEAASVSVDASAIDGGSIGYQWYVNTIPSTEGGLAVPGAVSSSCAVPTEEAGEHYYCCYVTNTNNGVTAGVWSSPIRVLVNGVSSISVATMPVMTKYVEGDALSTLGLQIEAVYSDGTVETISDSSVLGIFPLVFEEAGEQTVTISYRGKTCTFQVEVEKSKDLVEIVSMPSRMNYEVGDSIDITGLVLKVTKRGQETIVNSGFNWSPKIVTAEGSRPITVILEDGNSTTFNVTVAAGKKDQSIRIETLPDKLVYKVGDRLDVRGLTITVLTNKDSRVVSSGYTYSPATFTEANENQQVTVTYGNFSATFTVRVEADETAQPSPAPTAMPAPEQSAAPLIRVTPPPAETHTESGPPMIIILLAAVIALAAVAGAVIYIVMARRAKQAAAEEEAEEEAAPEEEAEPAEAGAEAPPAEEEAPPAPEAAHHGVEPDKTDYFEGLFDDEEKK